MQHFEHTIHGDEDTIIAPFFSFISFHTIYTLLTQESLLLLLPSEALDVVCLMVYVLHTVAGGSDMGPRGGVRALPILGPMKIRAFLTNTQSRCASVFLDDVL